MHGGPSPNAAAPAALRPLLDGIDTLSRLDGWLGVGCLVTLTTLMISKKIPDSAVPMSLLADHPNVQFNFFRKGIGTCATEMH